MGGEGKGFPWSYRLLSSSAVRVELGNEQEFLLGLRADHTFLPPGGTSYARISKHGLGQKVKFAYVAS